MIYIKTDKWTIPDFEILVIIGSVTVLYFATFFFTRELRDEIQDGLKIIEFKTIEEKYDFMDKQDRLSVEYKKFVIIAGGQKYIVTEEQYNQAEISDYLTLHLTPKREKTLKIEITK
jgi:hypothetical protein